MTVKLLTDHHLEFLSLKGGYTGSYKSTLVKMPHCWKSHVTAQILRYVLYPREAVSLNPFVKGCSTMLHETFIVVQ